LSTSSFNSKTTYFSTHLSERRCYFNNTRRAEGNKRTHIGELFL